MAASYTLDPIQMMGTLKVVTGTYAAGTDSSDSIELPMGAVFGVVFANTLMGGAPKYSVSGGTLTVTFNDKADTGYFVAFGR